MSSGPVGPCATCGSTRPTVPLDNLHVGEQCSDEILAPRNLARLHIVEGLLRAFDERAAIAEAVEGAVDREDALEQVPDGRPACHGAGVQVSLSGVPHHPVGDVSADDTAVQVLGEASGVRVVGGRGGHQGVPVKAETRQRRVAQVDEAAHELGDGRLDVQGGVELHSRDVHLPFMGDGDQAAGGRASHSRTVSTYEPANLAPGHRHPRHDAVVGLTLRCIISPGPPSGVRHEVRTREST